MRSVKKFTMAGLMLVISIATLVGCSSDSATNEAQVAGDASEQFVFKTTIQTPPVATMSVGFDAYLDEIEEKSDGRITFERYYSESLVKVPDVLDALSVGIADVGVIIPVQMASKIPLSTIIYTPAIFEDSLIGAQAIHDLYEELPAMNEELAKHNVMYGGQLTVPSSYLFTKNPIKSIADLKGLRIIAQGDQGILAEKLGAVPVNLTSTESFEALQRGTVDGAIFNLTAATTYNLEQVASHVYKLPLGGVGLLIGMNQDKFEALPEDLQNLVLEVAESHAEVFHQIYQVEGDQLALDKIAEAGGSITEPTAEDVSKLQTIAEETVFKNWINNNGPAAEEVMNQFIFLSQR